jgi:hypothetical protein
MRQKPAHLDHAWVGNSEGVAEDHYLMATDEDFERAAGKSGTESGTVSARREPHGLGREKRNDKATPLL